MRLVPVLAILSIDAVNLGGGPWTPLAVWKRAACERLHRVAWHATHDAELDREPRRMHQTREYAKSNTGMKTLSFI